MTTLARFKAATNLTNPEIGALLHVSAPTVQAALGGPANPPRGPLAREALPEHARDAMRLHLAHQAEMIRALQQYLLSATQDATTEGETDNG